MAPLIDGSSSTSAERPLPRFRFFDAFGPGFHSDRPLLALIDRFFLNLPRGENPLLLLTIVLLWFITTWLSSALLPAESRLYNKFVPACQPA